MVRAFYSSCLYTAIPSPCLARAFSSLCMDRSILFTCLVGGVLSPCKIRAFLSPCRDRYVFVSQCVWPELFYLLVWPEHFDLLVQKRSFIFFSGQMCSVMSPCLAGAVLSDQTSLIYLSGLKPMVDVISLMGRKNLCLRRRRLRNRFCATIS